MNDPEVLGAMIIFVHCRPGLNDLSADEDLEAVVLFMSREDVDNFLGLRITTQEMFNRSLVWPVFQGPEKIKMLRQFVLQP